MLFPATTAHIDSKYYFNEHHLIPIQIFNIHLTSSVISSYNSGDLGISIFPNSISLALKHLKKQTNYLTGVIDDPYSYESVSNRYKCSAWLRV
jgi:hypothetical protein